MLSVFYTVNLCILCFINCSSFCCLYNTFTYPCIYIYIIYIYTYDIYIYMYVRLDGWKKADLIGEEGALGVTLGRA
jgi:hypothetical protein